MSGVPAHPHIVVIDDNPGDIELIELGFAANALPVRIAQAGDGFQAQRLLGELDAAGDRPQLILLDINMPRSNGFEVLRFLERSRLFPSAPVVVLTTSNAAGERERCLALGAKDYLTKPSRFDDLLVLLKGLEPYLAHPGDALPGTACVPGEPPR